MSQPSLATALRSSYSDFPRPDHGPDPICAAVSSAYSGPFGHTHTARSPESPPGSHTVLLPSAPVTRGTLSLGRFVPWSRTGSVGALVQRREAERSLGSVPWAQAGDPSRAAGTDLGTGQGTVRRRPMQHHFLIPHPSRATNQKPHKTDSRGARAAPKQAQACLNSRELQPRANPRRPVGVRKQFPTYFVTWASE